MSMIFCHTEINVLGAAGIPITLLSRERYTGDAATCHMSTSQPVMLTKPSGPKCAGVIVFHYGRPLSSLNTDDKTLYVVVVKKAKQMPYPWGFPKGGREKDETVMENALRELDEETGIVEDQLHFLSDTPVKEYHDNMLTVLYYVAKFVGNPWKHKFTFSKDELETACWMPVHEVLKAPISTGMKPGRLDTLQQTVKQFEEILSKNGTRM